MTGFHANGASWGPPLPGSTPALVATIEISQALLPIEAHGYRWAYLLVLVNGVPAGWVTCPITNGRCTPREIRHAVGNNLALPVLSRVLEDRLCTPLSPGELEPKILFGLKSRARASSQRISVAVCTRDRPKQLARCLSALATLDPPALEVIVIDNASSTCAVRDLVESQFPTFRYFREDRVGLDWARNRALDVASADIIAFTDDDVVVDRHWLRAISCVFDDPDVSAVTGLIAPLELRTDAQLHFEVIGGFGRGFQKTWHRIDTCGPQPDVYHLGAGRFGAGANMAFRTSVLKGLGGFDPALDVGTATEGGGDLDVFLRLLHQGYTLVYEPAALVWHQHRDDAESLGRQISTWGTAIGAILTASFIRYPTFRRQLLAFGLIWSWRGYIGPLIRNCLGPGRVPRSLRFRPLARLFVGPLRYLESRRKALSLGAKPITVTSLQQADISEEVSIRSVDLALPFEPIVGLDNCRACIVHIRLRAKWIGSVRIENRGHTISSSELRTRVAQDLAENVLALCLTPQTIGRLISFRDLVDEHLAGDDDLHMDEFSPQFASIVVATRNRPEQLRRCVDSLMAQVVPFPFEVVIVDNDPSSGLTRLVLHDYPRIVYIVEPVQGLAQARNSGFRAARGEILVATDDDVVAPPGWLYELVQPFRFAHVGIATGFVAPLSLVHPAQREFEAMGGLGKGMRSFEMGLDWLASRSIQPPRAWDLGATANAAFRRDVLQDPRVGLLCEGLGPGTPAGGGEDAYLFYRAVRMGHGVYYEAQAVLHHEHRSDRRQLRRQMFNYARGHVAYLLTTLFHDRDVRALVRLVTTLPAWHVWRLLSPWRLADYGRILVLCELAGYVAGPWGWLHGRWRDERHQRGGRTAWAKPLGQLDAEAMPRLKERLDLT